MTQVSITSFNTLKASQAAFFFLLKANKSNVQLAPSSLMQLIYLAERLSYKELATPMVSDQMLSTRHGPVLSTLFYFLENQPKNSSSLPEHWTKAIDIQTVNDQPYASISNECPYQSNDDLLSLSDAEIEVLETTWTQYAQVSSKQLAIALHHSNLFPEWRWTEDDASHSIELEHLLQTLGYTTPQTDAIVKQIQTDEFISKLFDH
jgi:uncharacterized phage-associated protein